MKNVSLKIDEHVFSETEKILLRVKTSRNRYINEAIDYYNKLQRKIILEQKLKKDSELVRSDSMAVLGEFDTIEHDD